MNKFLFVFVSLCLFAPIQGLRKNRLLESLSSKRRLNGDLHPNHRRLSNNGQLHLKINGRGYFQFRLRVEQTDAGSNDNSQVASPEYHGAYQATKAVTSISTDGVVVCAELTTAPVVGDTLRISSADGKICPSDVVGLYEVKTKNSKTRFTLDSLTTEVNDGSLCVISDVNPADNAQADDIQTAYADGNGVEVATDNDINFFSQVVYGTDGSLHVNKYGYLVDDNGLLLVSEASDKKSVPKGTTDRSTDDNAKYHIHIPSRADGILVTPTGKVKAIELGGAVFSQVGQIRLARFENAQGLNIRLKMNSNCNAANEDGFALGNWCAGTALDGKEHVYYAETEVSGKGIIGNPGSQGFGRIVKVK